MVLEFMTGATVFALIDIALFIALAYFFIRIAVRATNFMEDPSDEKTLDIKFEIFSLAAITLIFLFFGSVTQPKLAIETPPNRELVEYQEGDKEVVIETPQPRTEKLEGFTPLKNE